MSGFADMIARSGQTRIASRVVTVEPELFHVDHRPPAEIAIGLRNHADAETGTAEAEAARRAFDLFPDESLPPDELIEARAKAFNDALMCEILAVSCCDPNDYSQLYFMGEGAVRDKLTTEGVQRLWQELEAFKIADSPSMPQAEDDDVDHLIALLSRDALELLPEVSRKRARRLLYAVYQDLAQAEEAANRDGEYLID